MIQLSQIHWPASFAAAVLAVSLASGTALAQTTPPRVPPPDTNVSKSEPSTWDKTKEMSRKEWNAARGKWTMEKAKWRGCNAKSKDQKLRGTKRWTFIGHCMTD